MLIIVNIIQCIYCLLLFYFHKCVWEDVWELCCYSSFQVCPADLAEKNLSQPLTTGLESCVQLLTHCWCLFAVLLRFGRRRGHDLHACGQPWRCRFTLFNFLNLSPSCKRKLSVLFNSSTAVTVSLTVWRLDLSSEFHFVLTQNVSAQNAGLFWVSFACYSSSSLEVFVLWRLQETDKSEDGVVFQSSLHCHTRASHTQIHPSLYLHVCMTYSPWFMWWVILFPIMPFTFGSVSHWMFDSHFVTWSRLDGLLCMCVNNDGLWLISYLVWEKAVSAECLYVMCSHMLTEDTYFGTIYTSDDRGILYSKSLERHLFGGEGKSDFTNVTSLRGVYLTNILEEGMNTCFMLFHESACPSSPDG